MYPYCDCDRCIYMYLWSHSLSASELEQQQRSMHIRLSAYSLRPLYMIWWTTRHERALDAPSYSERVWQQTMWVHVYICIHMIVYKYVLSFTLCIHVCTFCMHAYTVLTKGTCIYACRPTCICTCVYTRWSPTHPPTHPHTYSLSGWILKRACQSDWFQLLLICAVPDIPHLIVKMPAEREREIERERECEREWEWESESERGRVWSSTPYLAR